MARHRKISQRSGSVRTALKDVKPFEYVLCDLYTNHRVIFLNPVRFQQLVARGAATIVRAGIRGNIARLTERFRLNSSRLKESGEPDLIALSEETIWEENDGCPTGKICERLWRYDDAAHSLDEVIAFKEERKQAIHHETRYWGLPPIDPKRRIKLDFGVFGVRVFE
jgi:hypothetical protein